MNCVCLVLPKGFIASENDGLPEARGCIPPCVHQPIRIPLPAIPWASSPGWIYCLHLWPMLNPFTCQSAVNMMYGTAVYSRCVLKSIFLSPFGFTPLFNHLVYNRNIKMSKWPNYFCDINNALTVMAKLLQRAFVCWSAVASWFRRNFSPLSCKLWSLLCCLVDIFKQPGDIRQAKKLSGCDRLAGASSLFISVSGRRTSHRRSVFKFHTPSAYLPVSKQHWLEPGSL